MEGAAAQQVLRAPVRPTLVAFRPDGKAVAATAGSRALVFAAAGGEALATVKGHKRAVLALAYSPDGKLLASASADGTLNLLDAETNEVVGQRHLEIGKLTALAWWADSSRLAAGGDKVIAVLLEDFQVGVSA